MINLIPSHAKKSLVLEYWVRVVSVWLILWSLALVVGAAILLPAFVLITSQVETYESSALEASEKVATYRGVSAELGRANKQARTALDQLAAAPFSEYMSFIERIQGSDISLSGIDINQKGEQIEPIRLDGVALDRLALASFRDRLLAEDIVNEVDLPIQNLAQDRDIQFSITVTLNNI